MRAGLWGLAAVFLGAFGAHFLLRDRGYVRIDFLGYVIETSIRFSCWCWSRGISPFAGWRRCGVRRAAWARPWPSAASDAPGKS